MERNQNVLWNKVFGVNTIVIDKIKHDLSDDSCSIFPIKKIHVLDFTCIEFKSEILMLGVNVKVLLECIAQLFVFL